MSRRNIFIYSSIVGLFFLIAGSYVILKTEWGAQRVLRCLTLLFPNNVSFEGVHGHLLGKLIIKELQMKGENGEIVMQGITATTKWPFPYRRLVTENLAIDQIRIAPRFSALWNSKNSSLPHSPINLVALHIQLPHIKIQFENNRTFTLQPLNANAAISSDKLLFNVYNAQKGQSIFNLLQNKHYLSFNLDTTISKTTCQIQYSRKKKRFTLNGLMKDHLGGRIVLQGKGNNQNEQLIKITADHIHPDQIFPQYWPGIINFEMTLSQNKQQKKLQLQQLEGNIDEQPLSGEGFMVMEESRIPNLSLDLKSRSSRISITGKKFDRWEIQWIFNIPNLKLFLPQSAGTINARGSIQGHVDTPIIEGTVTANNLQIRNYQLQKANADIKLNIENDQAPCFLNFNATNLRINKLTLDQFSLTTQGSLRDHILQIAAKSKDQSLQAKLAAQWKKPTWTGQFSSINLNSHNQHWQLQKPAHFTIKKGRTELTSLLLGNSQSSLALLGVYQDPQHFNTKITIHNLDLDQLNFLLSENQRIEGKLNANLTAIGDVKGPDIELSGNLLPGAIYYDLNDEPQKNIFTGATFSAHTKSHLLDGTAKLQFPDGQLNAHVLIPLNNTLKANQKLEGKVTAQTSQLHFLELLIPAIKKVTGQIHADFALSGTMKAPLLRGNLILSDGRFEVPKLNLKITNVNAKVQADGKNITYNGHLTSGTGTLSAHGESRIEEKEIPINIQLDGSHVLVYNKPEIIISVSPKMTLQLSNKELRLNGNIFIDEGSLHPHDFGSTETASDDIVFVKPNGEERTRSNLKITSSISLSLGKNVTLNYKGIKGQLLGQLHIEDDPDKATVGYGQLQLEGGSYNVYGKTLQIDYGKLNFTGGPINNPGLDIRASRTLQASLHNTLFTSPEQIRVGVTVLGTLEEPKIDLFSEPAGISSSDILSYLLLGSPANAISETNSELLLEAASALNLKSTNKLLSLKDQIRKGLGLSELDIGTQSQTDPKTHETFQHTSFILGKYLSPKFYVNYSLDLFDHTNTLKVRYLLNRYWTIQSVANTNGSGVDVLYTVEK